MAERHTPIEEDILPLDCIYQECEHFDLEECPSRTMLVCSVCQVPAEWDEDYMLFVAWPCEYAEDTNVSSIHSKSAKSRH